MEEVRTLAKSVTVETRAKDSRFVADAVPVQSREEAERVVVFIAEQSPEATHHCFAYRIGTGDSAITRSNDDGEPAGTAGRPILQAIEARELSNLVVVVTRYFGGTKLGTGGLIRAYGGATFAALDAATVIRRVPHVALKTEVGYDQIGAVQHLLARLDGIVLREDYGATVRLQISLPKPRVEECVEGLRNLTSGKVKIEFLEP